MLNELLLDGCEFFKFFDLVMNVCFIIPAGAVEVGKKWQSIKLKNSMRWYSLSIDVFQKVISLNLYCRVIL